jgi:hypothetical protein
VLTGGNKSAHEGYSDCSLRSVAAQVLADGTTSMGALPIGLVRSPTARPLSATSAPGLGLTPPHLHRDWGSPRHICTGTAARRCHLRTAARLKKGRTACAHAHTRAHTHGVRRARTDTHARTRRKGTRMLGYDLQHAKVLPLVCLVVCTVTEFSSNVAIANIVLPILKEQVAANAQWGLFQVVTCFGGFNRVFSVQPSEHAVLLMFAASLSCRHGRAPPLTGRSHLRVASA